MEGGDGNVGIGDRFVEWSGGHDTVVGAESKDSMRKRHRQTYV